MLRGYKWCGSSGGMYAWQVQGSEFKPHYSKIKNHKIYDSVLFTFTFIIYEQNIPLENLKVQKHIKKKIKIAHNLIFEIATVTF
jgi:hypothetical protein